MKAVTDDHWMARGLPFGQLCSLEEEGLSVHDHRKGKRHCQRKGDKGGGQQSGVGLSHALHQIKDFGTDPSRGHAQRGQSL